MGRLHSLCRLQSLCGLQLTSPGPYLQKMLLKNKLSLPSCAGMLQKVLFLICCYHLSYSFTYTQQVTRWHLCMLLRSAPIHHILRPKVKPWQDLLVQGHILGLLGCFSMPPRPEAPSKPSPGQVLTSLPHRVPQQRAARGLAHRLQGLSFPGAPGTGLPQQRCQMWAWTGK